MMRLALVLVWLGLAAGAAEAAELRIAAASDLGFALEELRAVFERTRGVRLAVSLGSSGNLYGQIANGAPFDVFLSADVEYPRRLEGAGLAEPGSRRLYGAGRLVLWVPASSPLALDLRGLDVLMDPAVRKVAVTNPKHAPYGRAAVAALRHAGIYDKIASKLVYGESVMQAAQFVQSRAADAGLVALSLALAPAMRSEGRYWIVPREAHPPIEQAGVVLRRARTRGNLETARQFLDLLVGTEGRAILARDGFDLPRGTR